MQTQYSRSPAGRSSPEDIPRKKADDGQTQDS